MSASSPPPTVISFAFESSSVAAKPGKGIVALPGFVSVTPGSGEMAIAPVSVCHQVSTIGQRLPPIFSRYHIHASGLIGSPDGAEQAKARQIVLRRPVIAPLHERADRRGRGVEDRHAMPLADLPEAILLRPVGRALVHHARGAVGERAVDEIRMARDPAHVGGAPEDVVVLEVEHELRRRRARRRDSRRWCGRCLSVFRWCPRCRGCRARPRRPSSPARRWATRRA